MIDLNELERLQDAARKAQNKRIDPKLWAHEEVAFNVAIRNAARELIADAKRWKAVERMAKQNTSYDYGNGGYWSIGVYSEDNLLSFAQAIDAAIAKEKQ